MFGNRIKVSLIWPLNYFIDFGVGDLGVGDILAEQVSSEQEDFASVVRAPGLVSVFLPCRSNSFPLHH